MKPSAIDKLNIVGGQAEHEERLEKMNAMRRDGLHFEIFKKLQLPKEAYEAYRKRISKEHVSFYLNDTRLTIGEKELWNENKELWTESNMRDLIKETEAVFTFPQMADGWLNDVKDCPTATWSYVFGSITPDDDLHLLLIYRLAADLLRSRNCTTWWSPIVHCFTDE